MDASQYKDYVLVLLFVKYVSDRYAGQPFAPITIPEGASFADMVALKGKPDIGDQINKKILAPLAQAASLSDVPDFNDPNKLGSGKEMVDRLTNLIAIFENPALDFSQNRADGDDLLGDAYEYLMRHFATESGKSKGQFYTPAEVSRVIAQILGIRHAPTTNDTTVYDPTCGSGSLLLKIGDEARHDRKHVHVTLYGQEKDSSTAGLARMNMILHDYATAEIKQGNTLSNPLFTQGEALKTFDYVVANPPFSDKRWSTGLLPDEDPFDRFKGYGIPPAKQGDYAYLLHILRSLKSTGKGACILPHGVLFRGNAEASIRRNLIQRGVIKGIIGLPANLFYGTGIPACILVLDKEQAQARKGIFMIDASKGFRKDGPKNRLRMVKFVECFPDLQIVATLSRQLGWSHFKEIIPIKDDLKRDFYAEMCRIERWSVRTLRQKIDGMLYERTAISKKPDQLIRQELDALREDDKLTPDLVFQDPYVLDFLGLKDTYSEKDLESALVREVERFLLELGAGFAFVERQKRLTLDGDDYYMDLLFFHRRLRRLVMIELKLGDFKPADKGQVELYLRWLDRHERQPGEEPPMAIILCAGKKQETVEYLDLGRSGIHVAEYLTDLPPREVLRERFHQAIAAARARLVQGNSGATDGG